MASHAKKLTRLKTDSGDGSGLKPSALAEEGRLEWSLRVKALKPAQTGLSCLPWGARECVDEAGEGTWLDQAR